jgi:ComF family protein
MFESFLRQLQSWIFPSICILCYQLTETATDLCADCKSELPWVKQACYRCGQAFAGDTAMPCAHCLKSEPFYDNTFALCQYRSPIDHLITAAKFNNKLVYLRLLGELIAERTKIWYNQGALPSLIIPVPLHGRRLRERGYNQALEIARPVARLLGIPLDYWSCERVRVTAAQSNLRAKERGPNIKNAFTLKYPIRATHVAIIDDVVTTGHTVAELSRVLKTAGVAKVDVWCCARTDIGDYSAFEPKLNTTSM